MHHLHYRSVGNEQPEDVVLLCRDCHAEADKTRSAKNRPQRDDQVLEGLIVGPDGDHWGKLDPDTIYIPIRDGRYLPAGSLRTKPA